MSLFLVFGWRTFTFQQIPIHKPLDIFIKWSTKIECPSQTRLDTYKFSLPFTFVVFRCLVFRTILSDRAKKPLDMRSVNLASYPPFYFQNGGRRIKTKHVIVMAVMPLPSLWQFYNFGKHKHPQTPGSLDGYWLSPVKMIPKLSGISRCSTYYSTTYVTYWRTLWRLWTTSFAFRVWARVRLFGRFIFVVGSVWNAVIDMCFERHERVLIGFYAYWETHESSTRWI